MIPDNDKNENEQGRRWRILRLLLETTQTSSPYNQFSLAVAQDYEVTLCSFFPAKLNIHKGLEFYDGDGTIRGFLRNIRRALADREYDVVHCHTPHVALLFRVATLFRPRAELPPTVFTLHCDYSNLKPRNKLMLPVILRRFDRVVYCSRAVQDGLPRWLRRLEHHPAAVIQNGVDLQRVDRTLASLGPGESTDSDARFQVAGVGRLIPLKDPITVTRAVAEANIPDVRLSWIGEGPLRGELTSEAKRLGLEGASRITGVISREEVYRRLQESDVFVSASTREGLPVAVLEAMACRTPVILSDIPPHRELAESIDGIPLVQPHDVHGYANQLRRLAQMATVERRRIGERCRRLVEQRFSLANMHQQYERVFEELQSHAKAA